MDLRYLPTTSESTQMLCEQVNKLTWESCWLKPLNWGAKRASFALNPRGTNAVLSRVHSFLNSSPNAKAISPWPKSSILESHNKIKFFPTKIWNFCQDHDQLAKETYILYINYFMTLQKDKPTVNATYIHSQWVLMIYFFAVISKEIINKFWSVSQALDCTVHEACVSKIFQSC